MVRSRLRAASGSFFYIEVAGQRPTDIRTYSAEASQTEPSSRLAEIQSLVTVLTARTLLARTKQDDRSVKFAALEPEHSDEPLL